jgi:hypothetical protein
MTCYPSKFVLKEKKYSNDKDIMPMWSGNVSGTVSSDNNYNPYTFLFTEQYKNEKNIYMFNGTNSSGGGVNEFSYSDSYIYCNTFKLINSEISNKHFIDIEVKKLQNEFDRKITELTKKFDDSLQIDLNKSLMEDDEINFLESKINKFENIISEMKTKINSRKEFLTNRCIKDCSFKVEYDKSPYINNKKIQNLTNRMRILKDSDVEVFDLKHITKKIERLEEDNPEYFIS